MDNIDGGAFPHETIYGDINSNLHLSMFKVQKEFCEEIQKLEESKTFSINKWNRPEGAGGITHYLEGGDVFEKVGVSVSKVAGTMPVSTFLLLKGRKDNQTVPMNATYFTSGISGVVYPKNPHIPTLNFSYRYFEMTDGNDSIWWFTGGTDLTPYILNKNDCQHFHEILKTCCDLYDDSFYKTFKKACDEHFYLEHRGERRGIGGIFFNELNSLSQDICFRFVLTCMQNIIPSYMPIVLRNMEKKYFSADKDWQLIQRGRYVEFYLICDKTTNLVLKTPGVEYENILMCLPPSAKWYYNYTPDKNSKEYELINIFRNPVEWV